MAVKWEHAHVSMPLTEQQLAVAQFIEMCTAAAKLERGCHVCGGAITENDGRIAAVDALSREGRATAALITYKCLPCAAIEGYGLGGALA